MFLAACNFWPKLPGLNAHALPSLARWINAKLTNDHDAVLIRELLKKKKSQIRNLQIRVYQISHRGIEGKTWCLLRLLPYVERERHHLAAVRLKNSRMNIISNTLASEIESCLKVLPSTLSFISELYEQCVVSDFI